MNIKSLIVGAVAASALVASANAATDTISLPDIGTFGGYTDGNTSDTFTGNGFLGIYPPVQGTTFAHLFGLEYYGYVYSETELQASLAGLSGAHITSASLNFSINNGAGGNETVGVTSFTSTGTLGYNSSAPNDLGSLNASGITSGANSIDVTSLVQAAVTADQGELGLYLTPEGPADNNYLWTYTTGNPDAASASLVINYTAGVPDGGLTLAMLGMAVSGMAVLRRKL